MRETVLDFSIVGNTAVTVEDFSLAITLVVSILSSILCAIFAAVEALSVFESIYEVAFVSSLRLHQLA